MVIFEATEEKTACLLDLEYQSSGCSVCVCVVQGLIDAECSSLLLLLLICVHFLFLSHSLRRSYFPVADIEVTQSSGSVVDDAN